MLILSTYNDKPTNDDCSGFTTTSSKLTVFFQDVENIQNIIGKIKKSVHELVEIKQNVVTSRVNTTAMSTSLMEDLNNRVKEANKHATQVKVYITNLQETCHENVPETIDEDALKTAKIKENLLSNLTRQCATAVTELQKIQQECQIALKHKQRRQLQLLNPDLSNSELDEAMAVGVTDEALYGMVFRNHVFGSQN